MNIKIMKHKKHLIGVLVVILVVGGVYYYQNREIELKLDENMGIIYPDKKFGESLFNYQKRIIAYEKEYIKYMEELEKKDNYGGETPEETLELYIKALENKDFELASKYFVLEDQGREFEELVSLEDVEVSSRLNILGLGKNLSCNDTAGWCEIHGVFKNINILIARFVKNEQANIWKLESI